MRETLPGYFVRGDAAQSVYTMIRERIAMGQYDEGTVLTESRLAEECQVSRTPVRAALHRLKAEGIIKYTESGRAFIASDRGAEIAHIYALRIYLEMTAARITVPQLDAAEHEALRSSMEKMSFFKVRQDYENWQVAHEEFHRAIVGKAPPLWKSFIDELSIRAESYRKVYTTQIPGAWQIGMRDHQEVLSAVLASNGEGTADALARHYGRVAYLTIALISKVDSSDPGAVLREGVALLMRAQPEIQN